MEFDSSKLFSKVYREIPFPSPNTTGPTKIMRNTDRETPLYGPSMMPYDRATNICRDAIGRPIVKDGNGRLIANSPLAHAYVLRVSRPTIAAYFISKLLRNTESLNNMMRNVEMESCCVLDDSHVIIFTSKPSEKFSAFSVDSIGIAKTIVSLNDGPNRPTEAQLYEVVLRMRSSFSEYGVGILVKREEGFDYLILVPGPLEYMKLQAEYDKTETNLKKVMYDNIMKERKEDDDLHHAETKCTRSGKNFDDGHCDFWRSQLNRLKRKQLKYEKDAAAAATTVKRTRSGKGYDDGRSDALRVLLKRQKKHKKQREKLAATNATNSLVAHCPCCDRLFCTKNPHTDNGN